MAIIHRLINRQDRNDLEDTITATGPLPPSSRRAGGVVAAILISVAYFGVPIALQHYRNDMYNRQEEDTPHPTPSPTDYTGSFGCK